MHYRLYHAADFPHLYAIEESCFQPPLRFSRCTLRRLVEKPGSATWIARQDGEMTGFAIVARTDEPGRFRDPGSERAAYVETLEVSPAHRRNGVGAELLRRIEDSAQAAGASLVWLHVESTNEQAIRLYRAHGYQRQGREDHYYARGRNADIYSKPLIPVP